MGTTAWISLQREELPATEDPVTEHLVITASLQVFDLAASLFFQALAQVLIQFSIIFAHFLACFIPHPSFLLCM